MIDALKTNRLILRSYTEADRKETIRLLRNSEIGKTFMLPEFEDDAAS